ncbi:hypothetical protein QL285_045018 [Trifolium repens]|nr:hypothetical protein QL285_045018 [Trifolium repens]
MSYRTACTTLRSLLSVLLFAPVLISDLSGLCTPPLDCPPCYLQYLLKHECLPVLRVDQSGFQDFLSSPSWLATVVWIFSKFVLLMLANLLSNSSNGDGFLG